MGDDVETGLQGFGHEFFAFDDEQTALIAELLLPQRLYLFDFVFRNHRF